MGNAKKILAIESSCDETSVAITSNQQLLSCVTHTQLEHESYGGVVPEVAARAHLQKIENVCAAALEKANLRIDQIDAIGVTDRPGLAGALLVGISFAQGLGVSHNIPVYGINHLEGHIFSVLFEYPHCPFPFAALVVSGGHTSLYIVESFGHYTAIGHTIDDAVGEAYDKVGKLIGLAYPSGRIIDKKARSYPHTPSLTFPIADVGFQFSFSGLKTSVRYFWEKLDEQSRREKIDEICAAFQHAATEALVKTTIAGCKKHNISHLAVVGGVACNQGLRDKFKKRFTGELYIPSPSYCTDNAAMIAMAAELALKSGNTRNVHMQPSADLA